MLDATFRVAQELKVKGVTCSSTGGMYLGLSGTVDEEHPIALQSKFPILAYQKIVEVAADQFAKKTGMEVNVGGSGFRVTLTDRTGFPRIETAAAGSPLTGTFRPESPASMIGTFGNIPVFGNVGCRGLGLANLTVMQGPGGNLVPAPDTPPTSSPFGKSFARRSSAN